MPDAVDQLENKGFEKVVGICLIPWTEYVGKIVNVTDDVITLQASQIISITIAPDLLRQSRKLLRKGQHAGILALNDGSIRIRRLPVVRSIGP